MGRSKSSGRWLREHFDDPFVRKAQAEGWRSRAVFKLAELNDRYRLMRPGDRVVDLGAAPGGWSQLAHRIVGENGQVVALDLLPMDPLPGVEFILGDFTEEEALGQLEAALGGRRAHLVMSDMAPNMSGVDAIDQPRSMYLAELALDFARDWLEPGGHFVAKAFHGQGFDAFLADCREAFGKVLVKKPKASRPRSREVYLLGTGRKLN